MQRNMTAALRAVLFGTAALTAINLGLPAAAAPGEATLASSAPSSLSQSSAAELQRFLKLPEGNTIVSVSNHALPRHPSDSFDRFLMWNEIALDTTAIDHTPVDPHSTTINPLTFGEQFGPARSARAMAIVHIAMFDAVDAIDHRFEHYDEIGTVDGTVSRDRAIAQAAHDTLVWIYPYQKDRLDALLAEDVTLTSGSPEALAHGAALGARSAAAIIAKRTNDGSELPELTVGTGPNDFHVNPAPGYWSPDPVSNLQVTIGARWALVKPFVIASADQFRPAPPPALNSSAYTQAYRQVVRLGGDPANGTPTDRTARQSFIGRFWGYDGTPALCAPPRLYNMVARAVAVQGGMTNVTELARYLALVNVAMADAGISAWESKWHYQFWRPVTGIRRGDADGNAATSVDPSWYPIGAPATNTSGPNFTPPFPAYPSGHATFGGAIFETFRIFFPEMTKFTVVSDEFNGLNRDADGTVRPLKPETFKDFTEAETDNAESRIYNGVHWQFDADAGLAEGHQVAHWVFDHSFRRLH